MDEQDDPIEVGDVDALPPLPRTSSPPAPPPPSPQKQRPQRRPQQRAPLRDRAPPPPPPPRARQRRITDFARVENERSDADPSYSIVLRIFHFFNRRIAVPAILAAVHASAGDLRRAVRLLAAGSASACSAGADFSLAAVSADAADEIEEYFA